MRRFVYIFVLLSLMISCNNEKKLLENELKSLMQLNIEIPKFEKAICKATESQYIINKDALAKMIIFYDSTSCSTCEIARIWEWQRVIEHRKIVGNNFEPIFIFAPKQKNEEDAITALKIQAFDWPVFIDSKQSFISQNKELTSNKTLHTFLLDKNNHVVLAGNPTYNTQLWEIYKDAINSLIENEGVLP